MERWWVVGNTQDTKENASNGLQTANNETNEPVKPVEKTVGKTGACEAGSVKNLGSGSYIAGVDLSYGEYLVEDNTSNGSSDGDGGPAYSMYVYTSKADFTSDRFMSKTAEIFSYDSTVKENVKIDEGNYIEVKVDGKITCQ